MPSEIEKATVLPAENAGILKNRSGISACGFLQLPPEERHDQDREQHERGDDLDVAPAQRVGLDQPVRDEEQRRRAQDQTHDVELALLLGPGFADGRHRDEERDDADRHVQEEHRLPAEVLDHVAAERRAERERDARDAGPDAERLRPLVRREGHGDDRQRAGDQQRAADALERAGDDQLGRRGRETAREREHGEDDEPRRGTSACARSGRRGCRPVSSRDANASA